MITLEQVMSGSLRERSHHNGGEAFFAYTMQHVQFPRLSRYDRYDKKTKKVSSNWLVDGEDVASIEEGVRRLNVPPAFTEAELAALRTVTDEFVDLRKAFDYRIRSSLGDKGAIEWQAGKCRLTDIGRAAIAPPAGEDAVK